MKEIKLYKSPWRAIFLILLSSLFVSTGIWLLSSTDAPIYVGWMNVIFFGLGIIVGVLNLFDKTPQIIITRESIWDKTIKQEPINWEYILGAYPLNIHGQVFISLTLDKKFNFINRKYKWAALLNKQIGGQNVNLNLGQIKKLDPQTFIEFIEFMSQSTLTEREEKIKYFKENGFKTLGL